MPEIEVYNPLDKKHLAESVAKALLEQPVKPLPPEPFRRAGIYALYYSGDFPAYRRISAQKTESMWAVPIYVGSAVPKGSRRGGFGLGKKPGKVLFNRLKQHANSIEQVENLDLSDFSCRYLVTDDIWIPLGEQLLIHWFSPLWNQHLSGFGIHAPGKGRDKQATSEWDTLHPGRSFARDLPPRTKTAEELIEKIDAILEEQLKEKDDKEKSI
ncbi:Eco29kI family restriction endonuclease [Acidobacteria bacterium AH-259-D05]|nr:Eco29kI family restriction endonuclease [Acidobacteria bacterium AH-259-D05]